MEGSRFASGSSPAESDDSAEAASDGHGGPALAPLESDGSRIVRTGEGVPRAPKLPSELSAESVSPPVSHAAPKSSSSIEIALDVDDSGAPRAAWSSLPPPAGAFSRYGILGRLARGGMAEIFLARESFGTDAARHLIIKVLRIASGRDRPEDEAYFEAMFLREGRVAMQLSHPNICHTYEFGRWGGHFFIAMEWVEGLTVRALMERVGLSGQAMPVDVAVYIAAHVAAALDYAHSARDSQRRPLGVVHRDVTPHNVMLRYDGVVKLLDFGVAKAEQSEDDSQATTIKGKFGYMAPEQCAGRNLDGRADVFALGVCLFEMLSGKRLYQRGSQHETIRAIIEERPPALRAVRPDIPEELERIVMKALAKNPLDRFDTAGDMQEALIAFAASRGFVLSATRGRRWLLELCGEELFRSPRLETAPEVLERLAPLDGHTPLSSSRPPPPMREPEQRRARSTSSSVVERISTELSTPHTRKRWLSLAAAALLTAGLWAWWLNRPSLEDAAEPARAAEPSASATSAPSDAPSAPSGVASRKEPPAVDSSRDGLGQSGAREGAKEPAPADESPLENLKPATHVESDTASDQRAGEAAEEPAVERRGRRRSRTGRRREARPGFVADPGF